MEHILPALAQVFTPSVLLLMAFGTALGIMLGAIPGLTPTMSVAVLVPFTFVMDPATGLLLLGAVYGGSVYGGSISAILLNIPGAPANLATTWDGYPMARRGEAASAIQLSVTASAIGGVIGFGALLLAAPPLARVSLAFGMPENFWLAVFGITIIASLAAENLVKGLLSGAFGALLGTVGISAATGMERFTFGVPMIRAGVGLVAGLIGLFAIAQTIQSIEEYVSGEGGGVVVQVTGTLQEVLRRLVANTAATFRMVRFWVLGAVLGTLIGVIPGAGGQVAGPICYDQGRRITKNRAEWGKGSAEGIVTAEAGNNGMVGGSLVPMMTLGIPGSPTAAVLLGGLIIHGMFPGAALFDRHADVAYTFMVGMLVTQVLLFLIASAGAPYFAKVMDVPAYYLTPSILAVALFGAFAVRRNFGDVLFAVGIGLLMYVGLKLRFDPASAVLGLVLGPIAEDNLILSIRASQAFGSVPGYFLTRPISVLFIVLIVLSIVATAVQRRQSRKLRSQTGDQERLAAEAATWGRRNIITGVVLVVFAMAAYVPMHGRRWEFAVWPWVILGCFALLAALLVVQGASQHQRSGRIAAELSPAEVSPAPAGGDTRLLVAEQAAPAAVSDRASAPARIVIAASLVATGVYTALAITVGFYEATLLFLVGMPFLLNRELLHSGPKRLLIPLLFSGTFVTGLYLAFNVLMRVRIPSTFIG